MFIEERFLRLEDLCLEVRVGNVAERELGMSSLGISIVGTRGREFFF